jgi:hypothetical protein
MLEFLQPATGTHNLFVERAQCGAVEAMLTAYSNGMAAGKAKLDALDVAFLLLLLLLLLFSLTSNDVCCSHIELLMRISSPIHYCDITRRGSTRCLHTTRTSSIEQPINAIANLTRNRYSMKKVDDLPVVPDEELGLQYNPDYQYKTIKA